jgi:hypothetical protein
MTDLLNIALALLSIGLGAIGWLAPRYTMGVLDLATNGSTMGMSEIRAASGALFVGLGLGALILATPLAYAMVGFAWGGAAVGRLTSIIADGPTRTKVGFFTVEIAVAATLLALNL